MGRTALFEVMTMNEDMRKALIEKASLDRIRNLAEGSGMKTLRQSGIDRVLQGVTTVGELIRATAGGL